MRTLKFKPQPTVTFLAAVNQIPGGFRLLPSVYVALTWKGGSAVRPRSYVAFLPCRMQFKQLIMKQIISLSIVSIAFDTAEMRRMNRAFKSAWRTNQLEV